MWNGELCVRVRALTIMYFIIIMLESRLESTGCRRRPNIVPDGICAAVPSSSPDWSVGFFFFSTFLYRVCRHLCARARSCVFVRVSFKAKTPQRVGCVLSRSAECARARARVTTPSSGDVECRFPPSSSPPPVCRLAVWRLRLCRSFSRRCLVRLVVVPTPLFLDRRRTSLLTVKTLNFLFFRITHSVPKRTDRPVKQILYLRFINFSKTPTTTGAAVEAFPPPSL